EVRAIVEIRDEHAAPQTCATAGSGQPHRAPAVALRTPKPYPTSTDPIQAAVHRPTEAGNPARGEPRRAGLLGARQHAPLSVHNGAPHIREPRPQKDALPTATGADSGPVHSRRLRRVDTRGLTCQAARE